LIILVLAVEGGYYFWIQKRMAKQRTKNPVIVREEGVFTYVNTPDGENWIIKKMILGTIEKIDGNLLTIRTDNNKITQVLFTGENLLIANLTSSRAKPGNFETGTIDDLLIGDIVRVAEIDSENGEEITAKSLVIVRGVSR